MVGDRMSSENHPVQGVVLDWLMVLVYRVRSAEGVSVRLFVQNVNILIRNKTTCISMYFVRKLGIYLLLFNIYYWSRFCYSDCSRSRTVNVLMYIFIFNIKYVGVLKTMMHAFLNSLLCNLIKIFKKQNIVNLFFFVYLYLFIYILFSTINI